MPALRAGSTLYLWTSAYIFLPAFDNFINWFDLVKLVGVQIIVVDAPAVELIACANLDLIEFAQDIQLGQE